MDWVQEFGDELVTWVIEYAARRAVQAKAADKYVTTVLDQYRQTGVKTVEQAKAEAKKHEETVKANAPRPQSSYGRAPRVEAQPEWLGKKPAPTAPVDPERQAKINDRLAKLKALEEAGNATANN
jgi:DnaD/phage-associated family protein